MPQRKRKTQAFNMAKQDTLLTYLVKQKAKGRTIHVLMAEVDPATDVVTIKVAPQLKDGEEMEASEVLKFEVSATTANYLKKASE